jgi:hypothetical protein
VDAIDDPLNDDAVKLDENNRRQIDRIGKMLGSKDQPRWPSVNSSAGNHAVGIGGGCFLESRWQGNLGHVINIVDRATAINPNRSPNLTARINLGGPINPPCRSTHRADQPVRAAAGCSLSRLMWSKTLRWIRWIKRSDHKVQ